MGHTDRRIMTRTQIIEVLEKLVRLIEMGSESITDMRKAQEALAQLEPDKM